MNKKDLYWCSLCTKMTHSEKEMDNHECTPPSRQVSLNPKQELLKR